MEKDRLVLSMPIGLDEKPGPPLTDAELAIVDQIDRHSALHETEAEAIEWLDARVTALERSPRERLRDWWRIKRRALIAAGRGWLAGTR